MGKSSVKMEHGITAITSDFDSEDSGSIPDAPTKCIPITYLCNVMKLIPKYKSGSKTTAQPHNDGYKAPYAEISEVNPMLAEQQAISNLGAWLWNSIIDAYRYVTTNPATQAGRDAVNASANRVVRRIKETPDSTYFKGDTIREDNLPRNVQQEIAKQAQWAIDNDSRIKKAGGREKYFSKHPNDTLYIPFNAWKYYKENRGVRYGNDQGNYSSFDNMFGLNPDTFVEHTMGRFGISLDNKGYTISDTYDFNKGSGNYSNPKTLYEKGRVFMQKVGSHEDEPAEQKTHYQLRFDY